MNVRFQDSRGLKNEKWVIYIVDKKNVMQKSRATLVEAAEALGMLR